jgi:outer membrane protein OmpA-like peptidoglycan-associated protein
MFLNWINNLCSIRSGLMAVEQGHDTAVSRPAAWVCPVSRGVTRTLMFLSVLVAVALLPLNAISANFGDRITTRANVTSRGVSLASTSVTVTVFTRTPSTVEFLKYAPGVPEAISTHVPSTYYTNSSGSFTALSPPLISGTGKAIDLSSPVPLIKSAVFHAGEPMFVRLTDLDQNIDRSVAESVIVTITDPKTGDSETLKLTETGVDTGIFVGYIQTSSTASGGANSGTLSVSEASSVRAHYVDIMDGTDSAADAVLVDPFGIVFDTRTGKPVDGATVQLLNADGTAAAVFGDNGLVTNTYPNKVVSGSTATDRETNTYSFPPGGYRFPFVNPGSYILKVTPPTGYKSPSEISTTIIQSLPGAPFAILEPGSRGEIFAVPTGPAIRVDIPLDPKIGSLWLKKSAGKSLVSAGDYLGYELVLENKDIEGTVFSPVLIDKLPHGFRYQKGSAKVNGISVPDPAISPDGVTMTFALADILPATSVSIRYTVAIGAGAQTGIATNTAMATAAYSVKSNSAKATVQVQEPFMRSRNIIMGRVIVGACGENSEDNKKGMEGIGIYLEDGTFVISDKLGMFHFEGVKSGTHVVQLDLDSIPDGYKVLPCEQNSRFAGRAYSQFVDMQGGTMWRTDFYLGRPELYPLPAEAAAEKVVSSGKGTEAEPATLTGGGEKNSGAAVPEPYKGEISLEMISSQSGDFIDYRIPLQSAAVLLTNLRLTVFLPQGAAYVNGSSNFSDTVIADPKVTSGKVSYHLGAAGADWQKELRFRVAIGRKAKGGELQTKAILTFDSPAAKDISAPAVDNILSLVKEENQFNLPTVVVRPQFPTFGAELNEEDRKHLDELALMLGRFNIDKIDVVGHTDNVRIAPRSRNIHADNTALSFARARSVGRYLIAALHLPPEKLSLSGSGEKTPLATNKTDTGRAMNRRVEVNITATQTIETNHLKIIKERSGLQKQETTSRPVQLTEKTSTLVRPQLDPGQAGILSASNSSRDVIADAPPPEAGSVEQNATGDKGVQLKKSSRTAHENSEEHAVLASALNDGIVHYRIRLKNIKETLHRATVTLVMPNSLLYMSGTTQLGGTTVSDPEVNGSILKYNFTKLPDEKRFDLRIKTFSDGDIPNNESASMVSVIISDESGKPLKTYSATSELSEDMEEIIKPDVAPVQQQLNTTEGQLLSQDQSSVKEELLKPGIIRKSEYEEYHENIEKTADSANEATKTSTKNDNKLHVNDDAGILSPADGAYVATQHNSVRVVLNSALKPVLLLDGQEISAERIGFSMDDKESEKTLYVYIGIDFGDTGSHTLQLKGLDQLGVTRFDKSAKVIRTGEISAIKLVSADGNIADGRTPVRMRVQLFDKDDKPVSANAELVLKSEVLRPLTANGSSGLNTGSGGITIDSQGWMNFQPVNSSGQYRVQVSYNKAVLDIDTYVKPKMRDWILVGLAEGTAGYNTLSGHMENLQAAGQEEHLYDKERLALYAKGTIKGEWLLTMAYDSAKQRTGVSGDALFQTIDPNSFYTLYGDATSQLYDASSQRKLYLKIERDQFYALFGDFDSGLTITELSRYSRRMNGIKSELRTKYLDVTAFGSQTEQSFMKDEIQGDGTSGLFRLSRTGIVLNSEKITIESRDRFHSEVVTSSKSMSRFIDYSIDYDSGTLFFKSPVPSKDEQLNPIYIVVEYEITNTGNEAITYGGRAGTKLMDGKLNLGATHIHEGHVSGDGNLYGGDLTAQLGTGTRLRAEAATTSNDGTLGKTGGDAYLAEITHSDKTKDAKAYFREQEAGFGLGQQNQGESGTRKFGAEGGYKLNEKVTLSSQAYRQYTLATGAVRDFMELLASYNEKEYSLRSGVRYANDTLPDGSNASSLLGTAGASWKALNNKLTLRVDHDQALFSKNNNTDFPTKTTLGMDYLATKKVTLFAQEELTYGAAADTNTTRVGIKTTPWAGGSISSSVVNDIKENSDRTFANVGLAQKWQVNPRWMLDGGLDHNQTVRKKTGYQLDPAVPPAIGGEDFTAVSLGANYTEKKLVWANRVEYRTSEIDNKWGVISGVVNEQGLNWGWTTRLQILHTQTAGSSSKSDGSLRMGLAYRPPVTEWIILDRLDLIASEEKAPLFSTHGNRFVNNLNANYHPNKKTQLSLQYGAKYVLEQIDELDYSGFTDLVGAEGRYDITKEWDIGLRGSLLHTWAVSQFDYSYGPSVGYNVMENAWISVGYNFAGFKDRDFSAANYTAEGPFIQYRFKFDQNSVKEGLKKLGQ